MECDNDRVRVVATLPIYARSKPNQRGHWAKANKQTSEQRDAVRLMLTMPRPWLQQWAASKRPLQINLVRIRPARMRALDDDNLGTSLKAVRDGVADVIGVDDGSPQLKFTPSQETGPDYAVRIEITGGTL